MVFAISTFKVGLQQMKLKYLFNSWTLQNNFLKIAAYKMFVALLTKLSQE